MEFKNKVIGIVCLLSILFFIYLVFALNTSASPSSFSVDESVDSLYNITVTDVNITQVNITLHSNFTFNLTSNGTNASDLMFVNFTNITGNILIWTN